MKNLLFLAGIVLSTTAYAGVNGTAIINYSILNNTGATANSLTVDLTTSPTVTASSPFTTATPGANSITFTGGSVDNGDAATFGLEESGLNFIDFPTVTSYAWSSGSAQAALEMFFVVVDPSFDEGLELYNSDTANTHSYEDLYAMQGGSSILTAATSGSLGPTDSEVFTGAIDFAAGPITFGVTDAIDGFSIQGQFTATPEPATTGLCALMLLGVAVAVRRRQLRQQ